MTTDLTRLTSKFFMGQKVYLDGDREIKFIVTAFLWREQSLQVEIQWMHNGDLKSSWVDQRRLENAANPY